MKRPSWLKTRSTGAYECVSCKEKYIIRYDTKYAMHATSTSVDGKQGKHNNIIII